MSGKIQAIHGAEFQNERAKNLQFKIFIISLLHAPVYVSRYN